MTHLKSYVAPTSWNIRRKGVTFTTRPNPGAHPLALTMPIATLLKQLGFARITREAKRIVNDKAISIDGRVATDHRTGVGPMDSITIAPDYAYRCILDTKGRLVFTPINNADAKKKICKIVGKRTISGGKIQLNLTGGRAILADNKDYSVGDSLVIEVPSQKTLEHLPFATGNLAILMGGRHKGSIGTIATIEGDRAWIKTGEETIETLKKFTLVIGKDKPAVKL